MKRIVLFLATNLAVLVVLSVVLRLFGLDRAVYSATGINYGSLLAFSFVVGFTGEMVVRVEQVEEEHAHRGEDPALVGNRGGEHVVVGRDPVAGHEQQVLVVDDIQVADLAAGEVGVGLE